MATEKILNTRIKLRYDTYDNWHSENPTLLKGEVAIIELPSNPTNGDHGVIPPATLIKVGPGAFNSLPFLSATAADVHDWAKKTEEQFKAWIKDLIPVEVIDNGTGKFVTNVTVANDANGHHITITRADVTWTDIQDKPALQPAGSYKTTQTAVENKITKAAHVLTSLSQDANGEISYAVKELTTTDIGAATAAQGEKADKADAKLVGIDDGKTVVGYVDDAIASVTGGDITVDTAKNYDTTSGNIKTKFDAVEQAITDGIAEAKKYADDNDANTEYHIEYDSTSKKIKLVTGAASSDTQMEIDATPFIKDGMLKDVSYNADNNTLTFTWNTDGEDKTDTVVLSDILDPYTVEQNAETVQLTIGENLEISADLVMGSIDSSHFNAGVRDYYDLSTKLSDDLTTNGYLNSTTSTVSASLKKADSAVQPDALNNYKTKQTAVTDPTASGKSLTFIDTISQDAQGVISATKKNVNLDAYALKTDIHDGQLNFSMGGGLTGTADQFSANSSDNATFHVEIADQGVSTAKIEDSAVTTDKIAENAVTTAKIADNAVGAAQTKAVQGYAGADAEVWVFDCGAASTHA